MDIALKCQRGLERPFFGIQREEKEEQTFSSTSREEALLLDFCWTDFFDTSIRTITLSIPFVSNKNQIFIRLPSWCTSNEKQKDRQTMKARQALGLKGVVVESVCHPSWLHSSKSKNLCCTSSRRECVSPQLAPFEQE